MAYLTSASRRRTAAALQGKSLTILGLLLLAGGLVLVYAGRHLTFFYDEWTFALLRRGGGVGTYLEPHNGHLVLFSVLVYKLLFWLVGLHHYIPYQVVSILLHLLCCGLLYALARPRVGPLLALVPTTLLVFMGIAYQDLLWPFQIAYLGAVAGGLAALLLLERGRQPRDALAAGLLTWSVFSSGVGLAFVVTSAVMLIGRREPWRRLWIAILPVGLFALWYVGWGSGERITSQAVLGAPGYDGRAAAGAVAAIAGLTHRWGVPLGVALLIAVALAWRQRRRQGTPTPMLLAAAAGALTFWTLAALTRADSPDPTASRYLYVGAVFVMLIAVDAGLGVGWRGVWVGLAGVLVLGALVLNLRWLRDGERQLRAISTNVRAALGVLDVAGPVVSPTFAPDLADAPQISAGPYLALVRALGTPALSVSELQHAPEEIRVRSDRILAQAEKLHVTAARAPPAGVRLSCHREQPDPGSGLTLAISPGTRLELAGRGPGAPVYVRRFASQFGSAVLARLPGGGSGALRFPADRAPGVAWQVRLVTPRPIELCIS